LVFRAIRGFVGGHVLDRADNLFHRFRGARGCGVLEYGVVTVVRGEIVETRTRLCAAIGRVRAEDTAIHGLREEAVAAEPPFSSDWEFFAGLRERGPLPHTTRASKTACSNPCGVPAQLAGFRPAGRTRRRVGPWIDTARIYAQLYPALESGRPIARACRDRCAFTRAAIAAGHGDSAAPIRARDKAARRCAPCRSTAPLDGAFAGGRNPASCGYGHTDLSRPFSTPA